MSKNEKSIKQNKELWEKLEQINLIEIITELLGKDHSYGMIVDYLNKFYPNLLIDYSLPRFNRLLKSHGLNCNKESYNRKTNEWKLQYRYSNEEIKKFHKIGQQETIKKRLAKNKPFNPPQSKEYWMEKYNFDSMQGLEAAKKFKRENSPRCKEFYIKKGFSEENAVEKISMLAAIGALASLKNGQKPSTEKKIALFFEELNIKFSQQYRINIKEKTFRNKKCFIYDFFLPEFNLLIEANGTYWHADPLIYKPTDVICFPGQKLEAKYVWLADSQKKFRALEENYRFTTIWERDIINGSFKEKIKNELYNCK